MIQKISVKFFLGIFLITVIPAISAQHGLSGTDDWWNMSNQPVYENNQAESSLSFISVKGNQFVDENGKQVIFKGVNISDPSKLVKNEKWSKDHFKVIKTWGANIIRVPIHPIAWQQMGQQKYLRLLDEAIEWASELDLYLIFEWHSIGNLKTGLYQHPMYYTTKQETYNFWRTVANRYKENPIVAFYEIFNEPTTYNGQLGKISWQEWKEINEEIVDVIYAHDKKIVPLVAGFNWAYDLSQVEDHPIEREGIGYVSHPYPQKTTAPFEENWEKVWGYVADTYPLICTELGFMAADDPGAHIPCISDESYGKAIVNYFNKKGISFTVWCFDPHWPPQMISDWDYTPTMQGVFFKDVMLGKFKYSE